ncbi:hypothetical protein ACLOJK_040622 [Asimina triloba]
MVGNLGSFQGHSYVPQWDGRSSNSMAFVQFNGALLPNEQMLGETLSRSVDLVHEDNEICRTRQLMDCNPHKYCSSQGQGLSLTLGSHLPTDIPIPSFGYSQTKLQVNQAGCSGLSSREEPGGVHDHGMRQMREDYLFCGSSNKDNRFTTSSMSQSHSRQATDEVASFRTILQNSRYLKPAQNLLQEVVSIGKDLEIDSDRQPRQDISRRRVQQSGVGTSVMVAEAGRHSANQQKTSGVLTEGVCSSANIHDIRIRIAKLVALLDEVDSRYEQYCQRIGEVVSSFELIAGPGAAQTYTALTLQAMSRHFGSLRDEILTQIRVARRCLTKALPGIHSGLSRLSLLDQNAQQKRGSLQQLGVIQFQQGWRPLRGLPEDAVLILRAWLFEHFLHPAYGGECSLPFRITDFESSMIFVRLWKPMIEEIYREDVAEAAPAGSNPSSDNTSTGR